MRRKFVLLIAAVGVLMALAAPASSVAKITPGSNKFEIPGDANGPKLVTSLGSCTLKITGTVPLNESSASAFEVPAPVATSCTTGTSITISGKWRLLASQFPAVELFGESQSLVFHFASLPGCKLTASYGAELAGLWSNGVSSTMSYYHADASAPYFWQNDGSGTCALKGSEKVAYEDSKVNAAGGKSGIGAIVNNLTHPGTTPIVINPFP
jgi:hypothetical protein